jgi:hypothetical protein
MLTMKNVQFTKLLKAGISMREFNFRKTVTKEKTAYFHVDVTDDRNNRIAFNMEKIDGVWKIQSQQLPPWITDSETNLHELIESEMK